MIASHSAAEESLKIQAVAENQKPPATMLCRIASRFFAGRPARESVTTRILFRTSPEQVWRNMLFFEEIPAKPPLLLRLLLPQPVRTVGQKTRIGTRVRCVYTRGELIKRITSVVPTRSLCFEVVGQRLGIEDCLITLGGSYRIGRRGGKTEVELTTQYHSFLRPRFLWRKVEALLIGQLHRRIFHGLHDAFRIELAAGSAAVVLPSQRRSGGGLACTASPLSSRR